MPFRVFGPTAQQQRVAAPLHPLVEFTRRPEYLCSPRSADIGSRSHFAVGHFLGLVVFRDEHRPSRFRSSILPLVDLGVPPEPFSVVPSRAVLPKQNLDRLLSWALRPYNTCRSRGSTFRGPCQARFVPPSGFGYPLGGLLPPKPGRACFIPTAFLGFLPSERSPLPRWPPRFRNGRTRMPLARRDLPQANLRTGAKDTDFQALTLGRVPCRDRVISPPQAGGSPGILPFQGSPTGRLARTSTRDSPHALRSPCPKAKPHACLRVSVSDRLARLEICQRADETEPNNPLRVLVPACSHGLEAPTALAYGFASRATNRYRPS